MAGVKFTSYIDAIAHEMRAENLADHAAVLEVVENEHNEMIDTMKELKKRVEAVEANAELEHRRMLYRIEQIERKGDPEGRADK